jgi:hypothetical protein
MATKRSEPKIASSTTPARWDHSYGTYLTGRSHIDGADAAAIEAERRWGADRLRLLVDQPTREKFDRQRLLFNKAIQLGTLDDVVREAPRMATAWRVCDRMAMEAGAEPLPPERWEVALEDGTVAVVVPDSERAALVRYDGRAVAIYTMAEIGKLLGHYRQITAAKLTIPGATVTGVRMNVEDPLRWISAGASFDDERDVEPLPF